MHFLRRDRSEGNPQRILDDVETLERQQTQRQRKENRDDEVNNEEATRRKSLSPPASYDCYLDTAAMDCVNEGSVSHRLIPIPTEQCRILHLLFEFVPEPSVGWFSICSTN